jgi:hypothetical protein
MKWKKLSETRKMKARRIGSWPRAIPASEKLTAVTSLNASLASASVRNSV